MSTFKYVKGTSNGKEMLWLTEPPERLYNSDPANTVHRRGDRATNPYQNSQHTSPDQAARNGVTYVGLVLKLWGVEWSKVFGERIISLITPS